MRAFTQVIFSIFCVASCAGSARSASPEVEPRAFFEAFVGAQNAHDAAAVGSMIWNSDDFLWISRGVQVRGYGPAMDVYRTYYKGTWHLQADMSQFRATELMEDVVQILVPVTFQRGDPGQPPQSSEFLISQTLARLDGRWVITTILPVANTKLH